MIHIINQYPIDHATLDSFQSGDTILFLENAILALQKKDQGLSKLKQRILTHFNLCVRKNDMLKQGVSRKELVNNVAVIDDQEYLTITEHETVIKSWN